MYTVVKLQYTTQYNHRMCACVCVFTDTREETTRYNTVHDKPTVEQ